MQEVTSSPVLKQIKKPGMSKNLTMGAISILVVLAGIGTGYLLSGVGGKSQALEGSTAKVTKNEAGITDEKTFPDTTDGVLEEGGISGEGTHHIVRGSGPSQYAYLTSTVINLDLYVGKKVQVWGQTIAGKKAGWLMDVGKIKVIE